MRTALSALVLTAVWGLRLALYLNPDHALALVTLADVLERLKQTERAIEVYNRIPEEWPPEAPGAMRSQLLAAMMHTYDPGLLDFLHGVAADREGLPDFRVMAARSYAFLAAKTDVPRLRAIINAEPEGGQIRQIF